MSTELGHILNSGSRGVELKISRFFGGDKIGPCLQLSAREEDGRWGYVQLNKNDMLHLTKVWQKEIGVLGLTSLPSVN